jgi:hypothetical protein
MNPESFALSTVLAVSSCRPFYFNVLHKWSSYTKSLLIKIPIPASYKPTFQDLCTIFLYLGAVNGYLSSVVLNAEFVLRRFSEAACMKTAGGVKSE